MVSERKLANLNLDHEGRVQSFAEAKKELARNWAMISACIPEDLDPHYKNFVRGYFRAQVRIEAGDKKRGRRILEGLDKITGFKEFEDSNQELLAAIDIAVRGRTNRVDEIDNPIEPLFVLDKK